jgi:hypothetical protein
MDKIDRIISESIDKLVDEARRPARDPWAGLENTKTTIVRNNATYKFNDGTGKDKKKVDNVVGRPQKPVQKRAVARDFFSVNPDNASQIRRTLRKAWQPKLRSMYNLRDKLTCEFGVKNTQLALRSYGEMDEYGNQKIGLLTRYNELYQKLDSYTKNIEQYGSDIWSIKSRLREFPQILNDMVALLWQLCERSKGLGGKLPIASPGLNMNIVNGYKTSKGLKDKPIFKNKNSKEMMELTSYLSRLAEYIEDIANDNQVSMSDNMNIKTIRR